MSICPRGRYIVAHRAATESAFDAEHAGAGAGFAMVRAERGLQPQGTMVQAPATRTRREVTLLRSRQDGTWPEKDVHRLVRWSSRTPVSNRCSTHTTIPDRPDAEGCDLNDEGLLFSYAIDGQCFDRRGVARM